MGDLTKLRQLFIMRHAERVDFTFGSWIPSCFDKQENYVRLNLNMPLKVPKRKGGPWEFYKDCPLTRIGLHQATLTGEAVKSCDIRFSKVFCSPSLRCVETCTGVLNAAGLGHLPIHIEPGLFEWLSWYRDGMPKWLSLEELKDYGFNIVMDYQPVVKAEELASAKETSEEYYMRSFAVTKKILKNTSDNVFLVAHAASLDTCSRQLTGKAPRKEQDLLTIVPKATYASVAVVEQNMDGVWNLVEPPFPPLMHTNNTSFEWTTLLD